MKHPILAAFATVVFAAQGSQVLAAAAAARSTPASAPAPALPSPQGSGELLDGIAAVVNEGVVLVSQLDTEIVNITRRLREQKTELPPPAVLRKQVLERLVVEEIQIQRAARLGVNVPDEMVNNALNDVATRNNISFADLPRALEAQGLDYRDYRDTIRRELQLQILRQRDVLQRINISPRELEQFLARQKNGVDQASEYNLAHILVSVPVSATSDELAAREARAREVFAKARGGEEFAQLAVAYSDSGTNVQGGALGWRPGSQLPSVVVDSIPGMKPGDVTEPLRTPSGFHIFKLLEVRGGVQQAVESQVHARHILVQTNELEDDSTVQQKLKGIRTRIVEQNEDFAAIAAVTSSDKGSAVDGGDLGWTGPGSFVPEFEKTLDALKDTEISEPFKTQYGWHIVQLLGRRIHDTTDDVRRNRAFAALRESKAEEETELWLRRLRDEAFVEYKM
jgi:peptidyl-prolyl cis-trans isomerase SurA